MIEIKDIHCKVLKTLYATSLHGAKLSKANLREANLHGAKLSRANLRRADLSNADLSGTDLRDVDLSKADLCNANLSCANLSNADLSDTNLSNANLSWARLDNASLRHADLSNVNLYGVIGNDNQIKTIQSGKYWIVHTGTILQIGCEQHAITDWWGFDNCRILGMGGESALEWWKKWKPILQAIIEE